jgi:outer membrane receptor for ferrienterochelin and colicins
MNFIYKSKTLLCCLMLLTNITVAQYTSGRIYTDNGEKKETLPGVIVFWENTSLATTSDTLGVFQIKNPDNFPAKLIISIIGFTPDTILIKNPSNVPLEITLKNTLTLKEVTVGNKIPSTSYSMFNPINVETINKKELLKAACCNLSESFSTNASVDVMFNDAVSGAKTIQMLGLNGSYTQILSENMPMLRGLSSNYGLNYIPGTWIENIRVTKGAGSVVNGYESISGQINLEFLKPEQQKERLFINTYANHRGRLEANVHYAPKINSKWNTLLFLHSSDLSTKNDMNNDSFLDMPLTRQYNVFNRWNYHNNKNIEAQFGIKALHETRQGGQTNFNINSDKGSLNAYGIGINTNVVEGFSKIGFLFPSTPYKSIGLQTSGKWQQQNMFFGLKEYTGEEKNMYANLIFANIINNTNHKYKIGTSYLYDVFTEKFNDSSFARTESVPGIFTEYTYTHAENFSLVTGIRADAHNLYGMQYTPRLHMRYNPKKLTTLRLSAGRGFRVANIFIDNQSLFASSRKVIINEKFKPEIAWTYGISLTQKFNLFSNKSSINFDFFRTDFQNQIVSDLDKNVNEIWFYNLIEKSFANSFQTDWDITPIKRLDMKIAYKWYEVKTTYNGMLLDKPYVPKHRILWNISYSTYMDIWKFNFTSNWLGSNRIPNTLMNPAVYQLPQYSKSYFLFNAQVTKKFRRFEAYTGVENILNYTQKNPIIAPNNPFGNNFDASMIYAPIDGRIIYAGIRLSIK